MPIVWLNSYVRKGKTQGFEDVLEEVKQEVGTRKTKRTESGVKVKGVDNLLVRLSRCCNPVPGDEIVGYITKGRGVSVHRKDCPNVARNEVQGRLIPVEWENTGNQDKQYNVDIEISGYDRHGLLNEVLQAINETKTHITAVTGKANQNHMATIHITILIHNLHHLRKIVDRIKQIPDVYTVRRMIQ